MILDVAECDGARLARDPSYDGRFFTGVCTTGRLLRPNSLNFGLVFVVGLKPPRSPQPGRAPVRRLIGRCILSGIRREARGLEGDQECYRNRCAPLRGSHLTLRWRGLDSNCRFRDFRAWQQARPPACQTEVNPRFQAPRRSPMCFGMLPRRRRRAAMTECV